MISRMHILGSASIWAMFCDVLCGFAICSCFRLHVAGRFNEHRVVQLMVICWIGHFGPVMLMDDLCPSSFHAVIMDCREYEDQVENHDLLARKSIN